MSLLLILYIATAMFGLVFMNKLHNSLSNFQRDLLKIKEDLNSRIEDLEQRIENSQSREAKSPLLAENSIANEQKSNFYDKAMGNNDHSPSSDLKNRHERASNFFEHVADYFITGNPLIKFGAALVIFWIFFRFGYGTKLTVLFFAISALGLMIAIRLNSRINGIKQELAAVTRDLKRQIESLEQRISDRKPLEANIQQTHSSGIELVTPESIPLEMLNTTLTEDIQPISQVFEKSSPEHPKASVSQNTESINNDELSSRNQEHSHDPTSKIFGKVSRYFLTGNTLVKVGVLLIFLGISFLLKIAIDKNILPIEFRLIGSSILGLTLVRLGWVLRQRSRDYSLVLQGGGIGVLMLSTFVSLKPYGLISEPIAFFLLVAFTAATCVLAVYQNSRNLAVFGLLGGFLAPILASTSEGQHVVLFSYYTILNLGIIFISWKKAWRELNLLGFIFTFAIGTAWGVLKYNPDFYWTTQPFLIVFFLIYVAIPLIFASKKEPEMRGYVDGTIVFGNSLATFLLQLQLVKDTEYAGAYSALTLAAFYILLSRYLIKHKNTNYRLISEAFVSIGIVFTTVAIPIAFDGLKTSAIWALEAAGIYWVALRQNRQLPRYFATLLIFATSVSFFLGPERGNSDKIFLNTFFFSCLIMAVGAYFISYLSEKHSIKLSKSESAVSKLTFSMGSLWWILGGLYEVDRFTSSSRISSAIPQDAGTTHFERILNLQLLYLSLGTYIVFFIGQKIRWNKFRLLGHGFVFALIVAFLRSLSADSHPFANFGYYPWVVAFSVYYYILFFNDKKFDTQEKFFLRLGHAGALWVLVGILAREFNWLGKIYIGESSAWRIAAQGIIPMFAIWLVTKKKEWLPWPVQRNHSVYMQLGLAPIVILSWLWLMITNWTNNGNSEPLTYVPLLNPLELSHIGILLVSSVWIIKMLNVDWISDSFNKRDVGALVGATYFIWLNGVLCRAIHHYMDVPFDLSSLFSSAYVQVALSIYWTILGIAIMIYGSSKHYRWLWITGASLLAVVVGKLFLIDLSKTETMARVVSFIVVGILFLIVGYFSPIPSKVDHEETKDLGK